MIPIILPLIYGIDAWAEHWRYRRCKPDRKPNYHIVPTTDIVVIRAGLLGHAGSFMRWGLIFYCCRDTRKLPPLHNVRSEAIRVNPFVRKSFRSRRLPDSGIGFLWREITSRWHETVLLYMCQGRQSTFFRRHMDHYH